MTCENREKYIKHIIGSFFRIIDLLVVNPTFINLKNDFSNSISNATTINVTPANTFFYDYTSNYLVKNIKNMYKCLKKEYISKKKETFPLNLHFKIYNNQQFLYNETISLSPIDVIFFSRTQDELNFMTFNINFSEEELNILNLQRCSKHIWHKKENTYYRHDKNFLFSFTISFPDLIGERDYTVSTYHSSIVDGNQPKNYDRFRNKLLIKEIPNSALRAEPNTLSVSLFRLGVPVTHLSPKSLDEQYLKLSTINSAILNIPFTFGYNGISLVLDYISISSNGLIICYFLEKFNGSVIIDKNTGDNTYSIFSFTPGGFFKVNQNSSFSRMVSLNNFINLNYKTLNIISFGFSKIGCNAPQINKIMPNSNLRKIMTKSGNQNNTTDTTTTTDGPQMNPGLLVVDYDFITDGSTQGYESVSTFNVYTITGSSTLTTSTSGTEVPSNVTPSLAGNADGTTYSFLVIGGGGAGGIYLNTDGYVDGTSMTNEPGGSASGVVFGQISILPNQFAYCGALIGTGGSYYTVNATLSNITSGTPNGTLLTGTVDPNYEGLNQQGSNYVFQSGMIGTTTQMQIYHANPNSEKGFDIAGYVNAFGGLPGCISLWNNGSGIQPWPTNDWNNENQTIWGPVLFYNADYATSSTNSYTFVSISGNASVEPNTNFIFILKNLTEYNYYNLGGGGGAIFYNGGWGSGLAAGYFDNNCSQNEITEPFSLSYVDQDTGILTYVTIPTYSSDTDTTGNVYVYNPPFGGGGAGFGSGPGITPSYFYFNKKCTSFSDYTSLSVLPSGVSIYGGGYGYTDNGTITWTTPSERPSNATSFGGGGGGSTVGYCLSTTACNGYLGYINYEGNNYFQNGDGYQGCVILWWS